MSSGLHRRAPSSHIMAALTQLPRTHISASRHCSPATQTELTHRSVAFVLSIVQRLRPSSHAISQAPRTQTMPDSQSSGAVHCPSTHCSRAALPSPSLQRASPSSQTCGGRQAPFSQMLPPHRTPQPIHRPRSAVPLSVASNAGGPLRSTLCAIVSAPIAVIVVAIVTNLARLNYAIATNG